MSRIEDIDVRELIQAAGGQTALAQKMGYDKEGGRQKVQSWVYNGIPAHVLLHNRPFFRKLIRRHRAKLAAQEAANG